MSLVTAFPFEAYRGDLRWRATVGEKTGVALSLLTPGELERLATVEVRTRCGGEDKAAPWAPVLRRGVPHATFWDTRMGNFDFRSFPTQACRQCGVGVNDAQANAKYGNKRCHGHFGFIRMPHKPAGVPAVGAAGAGDDVVYVYQPHLQAELEQLLHAKCFFCHRLRCGDFDVARYIGALRLVDAGQVGDALHILATVLTARGVEARAGKRVREAGEGGAADASAALEGVINDVSILEAHVERLLRAGSRAAAASATPQQPQAAAAVSNSAQDVRNDIVKRALAEFRERGPECVHCGAHSPSVTSKNSQFYFHFTGKAAEANISKGKLTQPQLDAWEAENKKHGRKRSYLCANAARAHMKGLFERERAILALLFPSLGVPTVHVAAESALAPHRAYKVFFLDRLLVPPLPLRLSSGCKLQDNGAFSPDAATSALSSVLDYVDSIEAYYAIEHPTARQEVAHESNLRNLQLKVNETYLATLESFAKKEGLYRMHMMGKRVNQACRSVISPDYLVEPNEVLLPRPFARSLSFPEQVSFHSPARLAFLKRCVLNGPGVYPGATHIEVRRTNLGKKSLVAAAGTAAAAAAASGDSGDAATRHAAAGGGSDVLIFDLRVHANNLQNLVNKYLTPEEATHGNTVLVYRHVVDGDRLIFNRQPTLHKPSMMGYRAKVLSGLKTLRFHYINSKSYNADFDGDEMNVHIPQSLETRAELECLMDANLNFLQATSGKPIRGVIQDHVVAGVLLTLRDKFLSFDTMQQLLFVGLSPYAASTGGCLDLNAMLPPPAICKPRPLWTGKQLVGCVVRFVTGVFATAPPALGERPNCTVAEYPGKFGVTVRGTSLIQPSAYETTDPARPGQVLKPGKDADQLGDDRVLFHESALLSGVLCKNQLGPSGSSVAHAVHELYGPHATGKLFGALCRVLSTFLQREGFSMGMDDMRLVDERRRAEQLAALDRATLALPDGDEAKALGAVMARATALQKDFVPARMCVPFPTNQLLMMTVSGAKGSNTNTIQMALVLGQQLFDGQRVKRMNSGKTLPMHFVGDQRARAFGYAMGSFAAGIRPGEYTIHAMAGRDGLIDTAVKTSRSGHLQRCLIKGLESLTVRWDGSVRDCNGSVVQFAYGGDGLDPCKASTLTAWELVNDNLPDFGAKMGVTNTAAAAGDAADAASPAGGKQRAKTAARDEIGEAEDGADGDELDDDEEAERNLAARLDAAAAAEAAALPRRTALDMRAFFDGPKLQMQTFARVKTAARMVAAAAAGGPPVGERIAARQSEFRRALREQCTDVTARRRLLARSDAGEPVGLLAAQAAGEPSTQMTLNTFHSAGSTVTHVTEGIPRLRELLIHASVQKAAVVVPVKAMRSRADEDVIRAILNVAQPIKLASCLLPLAGGAARRFVVRRTATSTVVQLHLVFSDALLREAAGRMCMTVGEHVDSFGAALKNLAKRLAKELLGRARTLGGSGGGGATNGAVEDPAELGNPAAAAAGNDDDDDDDDAARRRRRSRRDGSDDDEDEDGSDVDSDGDGSNNDDARTGGGRTPVVRGGPAARGREPSPMQSDGATSDEDEAAKPVSKRNGAAAAASDSDAEDDAEDVKVIPAARSAAGAAAAGGTAVHYSELPRMRATYATGKVNVDIGVAPPDASMGPLARPGILTAVVAFTLPPNVVCVVPDAVATALAATDFPTPMPQVANVAFNRSADDASNGELVFQGDGATMRNVQTIVSLFPFDPAVIQLAKARSTDIRDMCNTLGVESGYRALLDELSKLFRRYAVDARHLSLIADTAMRRGVWENYNYTGVISHSVSPLFQMTFASSKRFLHTAVSRGISDDLQSISAAIIVGGRPKVGTATARVLHDPAVLRDVVERQVTGGAAATAAPVASAADFA